ncbi:MAG TPA: zinc-ribbon domain-containing protein [Methanomassiliicoccales archaeon]|nr:zinc-ribbon domain-containing protein [Methanomassiliicoccales archaeon]
MADLFGEPSFYILLIILVILSVVMYFELKFVKRKRLERAEAKIRTDEIYNQIVTARAVSGAIKGQGKNTKEADMAILQADTAYSRGSYTEASAAVEQAKELLREARKEPDPSMQFAELAEKEVQEKSPEECEVPFQETKKLPKNYMESKFMICSVKDQAGSAERKGADTSEARDSLRTADEAFAREDYTEALRQALKAKKYLEGDGGRPNESAKAKDMSSVEKVPSAVVVKANLSKCAKCGYGLEPDDMFCPRCGTRIERDIRCPRCANKVKVDDAYCRKCGLPLMSD